MIDAEPKIIPLDSSENICAITDEKGNIAGTGTREVCEVVIHIIRKLRNTNTRSHTTLAAKPWSRNVRSAITI